MTYYSVVAISSVVYFWRTAFRSWRTAMGQVILPGIGALVLIPVGILEAYHMAEPESGSGASLPRRRHGVRGRRSGPGTGRRPDDFCGTSRPRPSSVVRRCPQSGPDRSFTPPWWPPNIPVPNCRLGVTVTVWVVGLDRRLHRGGHRCLRLGCCFGVGDGLRGRRVGWPSAGVALSVTVCGACVSTTVWGCCALTSGAGVVLLMSRSGGRAGDDVTVRGHGRGRRSAGVPARRHRSHPCESGNSHPQRWAVRR